MVMNARKKIKQDDDVGSDSGCEPISVCMVRGDISRSCHLNIWCKEVNCVKVWGKSVPD